MSLMLKHQRANREKRSTEAAPTIVAVVGGASAGAIGRQQLAALLDNALAEDLKSLHDIHSIERKIEAKRDILIPKYRDYVARLRADGTRHDILGYFLVWLFDAGDMEGALDLGFELVGKQIGLPERFNRDLPTFMADAVIDWSDAEFEAGRSPEPYFSTLLECMEAWDLPDALRARYFRLGGLLCERAGDIEGAVSKLERAMSLGAKVKTKLAELTKLQSKSD